MVAVLNTEGQPLMPTYRHGKVKHMLKDGRAKIVSTFPVFTIQLTYQTTNYKQSVTFSSDTGSKHIGVSVSSEKKEFFAAQIDTRKEEIKDLLQTRRGNRRCRRTKMRSRESRFDNRTRKEGWLPPSTQSVVDVYERIIENMTKIFPITKIVLETGKFDMAKILNPDIQGTDYQQGLQKDYDNVKEYVKFRDNCQCRQCKAKGAKLEVHHIIHKSIGGSDRPDNLVTLCKSCHYKYHNKKLKLKDSIMNQPGKSLRDAPLMNIIRSYVIRHSHEKYECHEIKIVETFGYLTRFNRIRLGIYKSHSLDAFVASGNWKAEPCETELYIKLKRRHNRQLADYAPKKKTGKMKKSPGRVSKKELKEVKGFRKGDTVLYDGCKCTVIGLRKSGFLKLYNQKLDKNEDSISSKKLKLISHGQRHIVKNIERNNIYTNQK